MSDSISSRKDQHLDLCLNESVGFRQSTLLEQVELVHDALPELSLEEIDLSQELLGVRLAAPLVIAAMTGGSERGARINCDLAAAAQATGIGFGFGSQRRQLFEGSRLGFEVRDLAPDTLILGNIGIVQARESPAAALEDMVLAAGTPGVRVLCSAHSFDIIESDTSKVAVAQVLTELVSPRILLCIGDRGGWPGNDFELLRHRFSLSVDEVSSAPRSCWNLTPRGCLGPSATIRYLTALQPHSGAVRINMDAIEDLGTRI